MNDIHLILKYFPLHSALIFSIIGLVLYYLKSDVKYRAIVISVWGLVFIALYSSPKYALIVGCLGVVAYLMATWLFRLKNKAHKNTVMAFGIVFFVISLALFKYPIFSKNIEALSGIKALGISYFTFKFIHVLMDINRVRIKKFDFWTFMAFILFFPTFSAGPIDRYGRFSKDLNAASALEKEDVDFGVTRIITGLFKKFIIGDKTQKLIGIIAPSILGTNRGTLWIVVFLYSIKIYYDFSGYTDIAIGAGRLFGFKVPENFNKPYLKKNIVLFWQNWHMTLTSWLREYLFMPLGKTLMKTIGSKHTWLINTICQLVTMGIVGIWHGSTWNFLIWGIYHGVGLSLYRVYADLVNTYSTDDVRDWFNQSVVWKYFATTVTFIFVSIGWLFFIFKWDMALKILYKLF